MPEEFGTIKPVTQKQLELFASEVQHAEGANEGEPLSHAEITKREMAARLALKDKLDADELPSWAETFVRLMQENIPWKIAVYVAWSSVPKEMRVPRTLNELATEFLGLNSPRQIYEWRKHFDGIDVMIGSLQSQEFLEDRADVLNTVKFMAKQRDYKNAKYADMYLTMTGDLVKTSKLEAFLKQNGFTDDDLKGKSVAELKSLRATLLQNIKEQEALNKLAEEEDASE